MAKSTCDENAKAQQAMLKDRPSMMLGSTEKSYAHANPRFPAVEVKRLKCFSMSNNLGLLP